MLDENDISVVIEELKTEWRNNLTNSPEVKKVKNEISFHRRKIRDLMSELEFAENFEKQLIEEETQIENQAKPNLMRFYESLEQPDSIKLALIQEVVSTQDWQKIVAMTGEKIKFIDTTQRKNLVHLLWIVLKLRDEYTQRENGQALHYLQSQGRNLLNKLGDSAISWIGLNEKEVLIMQEVVQEVEKVPQFIRRIVETFLSGQTDVRIVYRETSAQTD